MPRKSKAVEISESGPTVEEELAEIAAAATPPGITAEPPIIAQPAVTSVPEEMDDDEDEDEAPKRVPLKERLGDIDESEIEELFKLAAISDKLQREAEQRARDIERAERDRIAREDAARKETEDQDYLRRLRKTDPVKYNEELDKREALEESRKDEVRRIRTVTDEFTSRLNKWVEGKFDSSILSKFRGKDYTQYDLIDGVLKYMEEIVEEERGRTKAEMEKELEPTIRKKILTELNGTDETPQSTTGQVRAKSKKTTLDNLQSESEVADAFARGLTGQPGGITKDQMVEWYRMHPGLARSR